MTANRSVALLDDVGQFDIVDDESIDGDASLSFSLSLSFRDLATVAGDPVSRSSPDHHSSLSSPPDSSFEFFSCGGGEMCLAEDVLLGGKLLPLMPRDPLPQRRLPSDHRRWSESQTVQKHRRMRRAASVTDRRDLRHPVAAAAVKLQPKWYLYVLGPMRIASEMDMEDIRSRQRKRTVTLAAPVAHAADGPDNTKSGTWRFLRSLSCNRVEIGAVEPRPVRFTSLIWRSEMGSVGSA